VERSFRNAGGLLTCRCEVMDDEADFRPCARRFRVETRARAFHAFGSQSKNSCRKYLGKKRRERWALYNFLTSNTNTYVV
jgi:hypothetical protein